MTIELPAADYNRQQFSKFCKRFGCELLKSKRSEQHLFIVSSEDPINFFWLGANLNFIYESGIAISAAAEIFTGCSKKKLTEDQAQKIVARHVLIGLNTGRKSGLQRTFYYCEDCKAWHTSTMIEGSKKLKA
jgi:hypothetical protein